jgi:glycine/D-amino acid oxidase-like deaminating enzyme
MHRRDFLRSSAALAALGLSGCARHVARTSAPATAPGLPFYDPVLPITPIRAREERIFKTTVCLRPFRAAGPRLDTETIGDTLVVHNYGHGGSGWSLSWGSSQIAVGKALSRGTAQEVAVLGCGALGLTSALLLQRAGARAIIYAKELPPDVRSCRATGSWTPDSRIALDSAVDPGFPALWEQMARTSYGRYQGYLGLAGTPVEWTEHYALSGVKLDQIQTGAKIQAAPAGPPVQAPEDFARYMHLIRDITPAAELLPAGSTPFPAPRVYRASSMTFNVAAYSRTLMDEFHLAGGRIENREFHEPQELTALPQKTVINCTGYGARALWRDDSITPVRGQIAWLIPQPDVTYGLNFDGLNVLARRDGIVLQLMQQGDATGWNDSNEQPDHAEAIAAVRQLADLYAHMALANTPARGHT